MKRAARRSAARRPRASRTRPRSAPRRTAGVRERRLVARLAAFVAATPEVGEAALLARDHGCRILLVGGAVRDLALGRPALDLDFILEGPARSFLSALARRLGHRVVTFRKRGIVDHRIRAGARDWDFVERGGRSLRGEILRRDFTVNAVAFDPLTGVVLDPAGGLEDLAKRRLRALAPGAFRDDPLRMLRAVRLRAEIPALSLEAGTARAILRDARLVRRCSAERVKAEMDRILGAALPSRSVRLLERVGLLAHLLPELDPLRGLVQNRYHHLDAFRHTLAALEAADRPRRLAARLPPVVFASDPLEAPAAAGADLPPERARLLRWALLLHDTGKAETRTRDADGEVHFYLHERPSARIAASVLRRLRASREETRQVETLVALHLRLSIPPRGSLSPRALRRIVRDAGPLTPLLALHSLADKVASRGPGHSRTLARLRRAARDLLAAWVAQAERERQGPRLLDGHAVMRALGLPPGPAIGALLAELDEARAAGEIRTRSEAIAWLRAHRPAGGTSGPGDASTGSSAPAPDA